MEGAIKKPVLISVYFDLPFFINVIDGFGDSDVEDWAKGYLSGQKNLPYSIYVPRPDEPSTTVLMSTLPVYIPEEFCEPYIVNVNNEGFVGIQFLSRINQNRQIKVAGEVLGDRAGKASFSSVKVNVDLSQFEESKINQDSFITDFALEAVNIFLGHYRIISRRFYITSITEEMIHDFIIFTEFDDGSTHSCIQQIGGGPAMGFGNRRLSGAVDDNLRQKLEENSPPLLFEVLDAEIRNKLDLQQWRLAVIECAILFETWMIETIRKGYENQGLNESEIDAKFINSGNIPISADLMAKTRIKEAINFDFKETQAYADWVTYCKNVRNEIVHGKKFIVTEREAKNAYQVIQNAILIIRDNIT